MKFFEEKNETNKIKKWEIDIMQVIEETQEETQEEEITDETILDLLLSNFVREGRTSLLAIMNHLAEEEVVEEVSDMMIEEEMTTAEEVIVILLEEVEDTVSLRLS